MMEAAETLILTDFESLPELKHFAQMDVYFW